VSYRQDPVDPETLIQHFGEIVNAGPVEPQMDRPEPRVRDFRYPDDLEVFFHKLPEKLQEEVAKLLAEALVASIGRQSNAGIKFERLLSARAQRCDAALRWRAATGEESSRSPAPSGSDSALMRDNSLKSNSSERLQLA